MGTYDEQRQARITKNKLLFQQLELENASRKVTAVAGTRSKSESRPTKRRKKSKVSARPQRSSARIADSGVKPVYTEEKIFVPTDGRASNKGTKKRSLGLVALPSSPTSGQEDGPADIEALKKKWTSWTPTVSPPSRDSEGTFHFESHPDFLPNKSPAEMIREGVFGGSYWRPLYSQTLRATISDDYLELPQDWYAGLLVNVYLTSPEYNAEINKYGVQAGQSIEAWEAAGWINHDFDPRGWFQWLCRYFQGRRCEDDERQISRWKGCVGETGRWRRILLKRYGEAGIRSVNEGDDEDDVVKGEEQRRDVSPVVHQTCLHWAWEVRQGVLDEWWANSGR